MLTAAAAIAGLAVAQWTAHLAGIVQPAPLGSREYSVLDWRVVAFALGLAGITGILFGVLPASMIGRLHPGSRVSTPGRLRGVLVAVQAALTVTLAAGAFSMGRSFLTLLGLDLGYRTGQVVTLSVSFPDTRSSAAFRRVALERLRAVPGVSSAGASAYLPLIPVRMYEGNYYTLEGDPVERSSRVTSVSPGYFRTMGTPLLEGRDFIDGDQKRAAPVVIVNQAFARAFSTRKGWSAARSGSTAG